MDSIKAKRGIYLSLGSNQGNRRRQLQAALEGLAQSGAAPVACSPVYATEPVGGPPQDDFLNLVVEVETALGPAELLAAARQVELSLGRRRDGERWGPRSLDIDLILYRDQVLDTPDLQIPHPRMHLRRFVLAPLADLAADCRDPASGRTVGRLLQRCPDRSRVERLESPPTFG
jgi:2-amino-4-hydroxy-6-hydroxymethyldihydropteridine diphosphokinase